MAKLYRPKEPFTAPYDGHDYSFSRDTLVEEGHPVLDAFGALFEEVVPEFRAPAVEAASAAPGEKRKR